MTSERGTPASRGRALVFEIDERVRIVGGVRHTRHPAHPLALVCAGRERDSVRLREIGRSVEVVVGVGKPRVRAGG